MKITKQQWDQAIQAFFNDEDELRRKMRQFKSIDTEAALAFVNWVVDNKWSDPEMTGQYTNEVTGEVIDRTELKRRYEESKVITGPTIDTDHPDGEGIREVLSRHGFGKRVGGRITY